MTSIQNEGTITFWLEHQHSDWSTNSNQYNFGPFTSHGLKVTATKYQDKTLEIDIDGPLGHHVNFKQPTPAGDKRGVSVAITWKGSNINIFLQGKRVAKKVV